MPLYIAILVYTVLAIAAGYVFDRDIIACLYPYLINWWLFAVCALSALASLTVGAVLLRDRPRRPFPAAAAVVRRLVDGQALAGWAFLGALCVLMASFTTIKTILPELQPFWADPALAALGLHLHFGFNSWELLHPWLAHPPITAFLEFCYGPGWAIVAALAPVLVSVCCRDRALRARYLAAFLLCWILNGTVFAGLFMSGGPAFYGDLTGDHERYGRLLGYLQSVATGPDSAFTI